jgi:hypothetical protein
MKQSKKCLACIHPKDCYVCHYEHTCRPKKEAPKCQVMCSCGEATPEMLADIDAEWHRHGIKQCLEGDDDVCHPLEKSTLPDWEKEFMGFATFRFEFTDNEGKRRYEVCSWNDPMPTVEVLKKIHQHIAEYPNGRLTDFVINDNFKTFIQVLLAQKEQEVREECMERISKNLFSAQTCFTGKPSKEYMAGFNDRNEVLKFTIKAISESLKSNNPKKI